MTTIAWYQNEAGLPPSINMYDSPYSTPLVDNADSLPMVDTPALISAGFVGEAVTGTIEVLTEWAGVSGSVIPDVAVVGYDRLVWNGVDWDIVSSHTYLRITTLSDTYGVLDLRVKIDGVYCVGQLTLTVSPSDPSYYNAIAWDWAEGAAVGPFWTALVQAKQEPVV